MRSRRRGESGIALPTAIVAAVVVSITAVVVLNLTMRRLDFSVFRTDRAVSLMASEAGFQYAFARLGMDPAFDAAVRADANVYVVSSLAAGTLITVPYNGGRQAFTVDEQERGLFVGRHVHVLIEEFAEVPPIVPPRLRIHAYSDYGTG